MVTRVKTTYRFKSPEKKALMSSVELKKYVEVAQAAMRARAAARGGKCVCDDNKCPNKVDDSGFMCESHRLQFAYWRPQLVELGGYMPHEFTVQFQQKRNV